MKRCSTCKVERPEAEFSRNKAMKSGRANVCKMCFSTYNKSPRNLANRKVRRAANLPRSLLTECRCRARASGVPFNLTAEDLAIPAACPVLGFPLEFTLGERTDRTPTVDRIDPALGYTKGNVAIVSWLANRLKSDCTDPAIFEAIARYMRNAATVHAECRNTSRPDIGRALSSFRCMSGVSAGRLLSPIAVPGKRSRASMT